MKTLLTGILLLSACTLHAATATLAWNKSTDPSVVGYHLYQGGVSRVYTNMMTATPATTTNVVAGNLTVGSTYFFAVTSFTASGLESPFSAEISYLVPSGIPVITSQPVGSTNQTGSSFTFSVVASGANLGYQWFFNGSTVGGATNRTFSINSVTWANNGNYTVVVSNQNGSVTSTPAVFAVIPLPPTGLTVGP